MLSGIDMRREMFSEIHESLGGNLHYIICSGAYLNPEIEEFMHDIGIPIITGYGLTECSPCVAITRMYNYRMGSVGLPIECCEVTVHEPDANGIGELYVKGDNIMIGYYNDPVSTAEAFDGEWLKTGDYGYIDKDGYIRVKVAQPSKWMLKHRYLWEQVTGEKLRKGDRVIFLDGNKRNITAENLAKVSGSQLARLNQNHLLYADADLSRTGVLMAKLLEAKTKAKKRKQ